MFPKKLKDRAKKRKTNKKHLSCENELKKIVQTVVTEFRIDQNGKVGYWDKIGIFIERVFLFRF